MTVEHDKQAAPEVIYGPEPRPSWGTPSPPPKLGPLPEHIDVGSVPVDTERTFLVAAPFMLHRGHARGELHTSIEPRVAKSNTPSAFRDELGLDPDPVQDAASAEAFHLASPAMHPVTEYGPPPPVRVRFKPSRLGQFEVVVRISVVADDGTTDAKIIRVTGVGTQGKQAPKIVNDVRAPNLNKTLEGALVVDPGTFTEVSDVETFDGAKSTAMSEAGRLKDSQAAGVALANEEINSYQKQRVPPSMFDEIIEIAFMMGVSGIAGVVAKYVAQNLNGMLSKAAPNPAQPNGPSSPATTSPTPAQGGKAPDSADLGSASEPVKKDALSAAMEHSLRDGFKSAAKLARKGASGSQKSGEDQQPRRKHSSNAAIDFLGQHLKLVSDRGAAYNNVVIKMSEMLRNVEPSQGRAAMITLARGMASASAVADQIQHHATSLEWIAAVARGANGATGGELPDGSKADTTNLDGTRGYGAETWYSESGVAKHDGVLDIHVELPVGRTPVEMSGFKVKSASIVGVSQELADKLVDLHLAHAGIPIRLVVSGHPALITRDELGRVRINGYLLTKDASNDGGSPQWTEAHMHRGAKLLVDRVLSKTLRAWGIEAPKSDDATGRGNVVK